MVKRYDSPRAQRIQLVIMAILMLLLVVFLVGGGPAIVGKALR